ncbi:MAG: carbohydrate ABC transporter permease [Anaerolineae bacterium]
MQSWPPTIIPSPVIWRNYTDVFDYAPLHRYMWNTLLVAIFWVFGATVTSSLAGYAFGRLRAPGRNMVFYVLLSTLMVPGIVTMIPTYIIFSKLQWVDTFLPLIIPPLLGSPFYIFLMRQFLLTIPMDLEDAALIDGCSHFGTWWRIMLPLAKPALATVAIFAFMWAVNDFMGPLIYLNSKRLYTLSLGLQVFRRSHGTEWGMLMAASTMMVTPIIVLFFFAQKQFVQGITLTGLKG